MGFLDRKKNEEWIDGTPESFKIWFWIRLAVCLFLFYTGGELIYRYVRGEIDQTAVLVIAIILIVCGVVFLILDVSRYIKLRRTMKRRAEEEIEDSGRTDSVSSLGPGPSLSRVLECDTDDSPDGKEHEYKPSGIKAFATYVVDDNTIDEEDEGDDEI